MKELSIEEKAKAYDEAFRIAQELYNNPNSSNIGRGYVCTAFPELKENEDERIRKVLLEMVHDTAGNSLWIDYNVYEEDVIAWLEKQGKQKPTLPIWKYKNDNTPLSRDSLILNKYGCVAKSPAGALVSDVWVIDYNELAKLPKEEIEKQGNHELQSESALEAIEREELKVSMSGNEPKVRAEECEWLWKK